MSATEIPATADEPVIRLVPTAEERLLRESVGAIVRLAFRSDESIEEGAPSEAADDGDTVPMDAGELEGEDEGDEGDDGDDDEADDGEA